MPSWKKVIVSGSQAHLSGITSSVLTDTNLLIANPGGAIANSGLTYDGTTLAIGSANITSAGNSSILTGSFSGSFAGTFTGNLNSVILANSNNGRQYSTNGGTTASLNTITFRDTDTTSDVTQSIGRIAFESSDTDTSGSNNSQLVRAFIEAVSEDTSPDTFLAFGTAQSGSLAQERMRINSSGRVGIGVTTPTALLHVVGTNNQSLLQVGSPGVNDAHLFVSGSGRVGINTTTPDAFLSVVGTNPTIILRASSLGSPNAFVVSGSGNVGIGTGTPTNTLQVAGSGIATTNLTASGGGYLLTNDNNGRQYSTNGGASTSLNTLTFRDTDTTSDVTQSIGRIAFESFDTDTSGSNNSQVVRAFIEAVSEDTSPDAFLAFGTAQSGSLAQERMRINSSGRVGIGTGTPTNTLQVVGGVTAVSFTGSLFGTASAVAPNSVTLGTDTTGNYVANLGTGTGVTIGSNTGEGSQPTIAVNYGSSANTAVQGNTNITINGTTNEIEITGTTAQALGGGPSYTIGLPNDVTVTNNLTVGGNLTVNGDTTILNVANVLVEDRFILLASGSISGSATHVDGGIIVQYTTGSGGSPTGSALFLNSKVEVTSPNNQTFSARWGLNNSVGHTQTTLNPTDYLVSVTRSSLVPTAAPEFGGQLLGFGNMYIQNNGDIWFWSPDLADNQDNIVYAG